MFENSFNHDLCSSFALAQIDDLFCATEQDHMEREVDSYLRRRYETSIRDIEVVHKENLDLVRLISMLTHKLCHE